MGKLAFVFPGQGSQYVGMGQQLAESCPEARQVFDDADRALGFSISRICFEGPEETLKQTMYTQPAILTVSIACLQVLSARGIRPEFAAGHSLGEYSALVAAGVLDFTDAIRLVHARGRYMEEAVPGGRGTMAAILGLTGDEVQEVCRQVSGSGLVQPANFNCPGQVVIAGERAAVVAAMEMAVERGAKKAVPLTVSGPFHSTLMRPAGDKLAGNIQETTFSEPGFPVVANVSADYIHYAEEARALLIRQVSEPVLWEQSVRRLLADGADRFVEVGPERVLSGLIRKIDNGVSNMNIDDTGSMEKTLASLGECG
ncbi:MAG: ACP S-malonyltransferase [Bacillota bacterium]